MNNIKIVYFDSVGINSSAFEVRLRNLCNSIFVIKEGFVLVNYSGSARDLFDSLFTSENRYNVLIHDLDTSENTYWGFMNRALWMWLQNNRQEHDSFT